MQLKGIALIPTDKEADERTLRDVILQIASLKPETLVIIQSSGHYFVDAISLDYVTELDFGDKKLSCDMAILDELNRILPREGVPTVFINPVRAKEYQVGFDFDPTVERFIELTKRSIEDFKVVSLTAADLERGQLLETGRSLREAIEVSEHPTVIVDFTSLETEDQAYSEAIKAALRFGDPESILMVEPPRTLKREYDSLVIGLGATDKLKTFAGLFGSTVSEAALIQFVVERVLANVDENDNTDFTAPSLIEYWDEHLKKMREELIAAESEVLKMVRAAVELWVTEGRVLDFDTFAETGIREPELLERLKNQRTGVFVSILKDGKDRGNMGTVTPVTDDIAHEIINNAVEAAAYDQRFIPVEPEELDELTYQVYVLDPPESVYEESELDPKEYGLIVEQGLKRGVVLPEEVSTVAEQIALAKERAGIDDITDQLDPMIMSRFTVESF